MSREAIKIYEVGPRDGLQNEKKVLSLDERLRFIELLVDAGHSYIEIGAFVNPKAVPQVAQSGDLFQQLPKRDGVHYSALVPNRRGYEQAREAGMTEIALFPAVTESFSKRNLNCTVDECFQRYEEFVPEAISSGIFVRSHMSVAFGCPFEGDVETGAVVGIVKRLADLGVEEISFADTIGKAVPTDIERVLAAVQKDYPIGNMVLHMHDTHGMGLANCLRGYQLGVRSFDCSAGGLGGCPFAEDATGNLATEKLLYIFEGMGNKTGIDQAKHAEAARYVTQLFR